MKIAGFQKSSFVDFPKIMSCVVFTPGCNMRCDYCHNKHILYGDVPKVDELTVLDYLNKRKGFLKGVVISGGEPTLQPDLESFVKTVKAMGFKVKLDTNGTNPDILKGLCKKGYIDYVAMDLKAPIDRYSELCRTEIDTEKVLESIEYLKKSGISYEFRTTYYPELQKSDIIRISTELAEDSDYYLQQYRQIENCPAPHPSSYVEETANAVIENGGKCVVRGL